MRRSRSWRLVGAAAVAAGLMASVLWLAWPVLAAEVEDPGAAGNGFVMLVFSTDYIKGPYTVGYSIVLPDGMVVEEADLPLYGVLAILCSQADGAGSCNASATSLGSASDEWDEGVGTDHVRFSGGGDGTAWCGTKCYIKPGTVKGAGTNPGDIRVEGAWIASEGFVVTLGGETAPPAWHADWYSSSAPTTTTTTVPPTTTTTAPPDPSLRVYLPTPPARIEEAATVTMLLADAAAEEAVACVAGGGASVTGSPSEGATDVDGMYDFELVWADAGVYSVECAWGDPVDTVRAVVTVGSGMDDVLGGECDCGAWWNIGCHTGCVLKWAFVPDNPDDLFTDLWETAGESFPFSMLADVLDSVDAVVAEGEAGAASRELFNIPVYVNGPEGENLIFYLPDTEEVGGGASCDFSDSEGGEDVCRANAYNFGGNGGAAALWGYADDLRLVASVFLYVGFAFAAWKWAEKKIEGGSV